MKPENRPKILFEGREYDDYQATQKQRQIEHAIRKQKRLKIAFEDAGLTGEAQSSGIRLRRLNEKYRQFSKAAGLPEQRERMKVSYVDDASKEMAEKLLEKRVQSGILKETGGTLHEITEEAIQRVPKVVPEGWSMEQAERLQEAHKDLLRAVKDKLVGTEAGAIYTPDMRLIERRLGDDATQTVSLPHYAVPHILIHNHPDGLTFSMADIESFGMRFDLETMTAVGNNGTVYLLQKTAAYDPVGFSKALLTEQSKLKGIHTPEKYAEEINRFLREAEQYGTRFIAGGKSVF